MQVDFGTGNLTATVNNIANSTPRPFGIVQDVSLDFNFSIKKLYGQYQVAVDIARGALDIKAAAKLARIQGGLLNDLFFAQTNTTSSGVLLATNENHAIPTTPYQVTVTNSAAFVADQGVLYTATGVQLTQVASAPATGQYSVNTATGVYTFAAADTGLSVYISYTYTTASGANKTTLSQQLMGAGPRFTMVLATTYQSKVANLVLNQCTSTKLSMPFKNQDYTILGMDIEIMADASNNIGTLTFSE